MMERELIPLLQNMGQPRIAVVGDFMLDRTIWGEASRVSPEAPVPVVQVDREEDRPGGAGNVAANLVELGAKVSCFGAVGTDESATLLLQGLEALGVETQGIVACTDRPTVQKIRVMAQNQQMVRVDREESHPIPPTASAHLLKALADAKWDGIILSDYAKGVLAPETIQAVIQLAHSRNAFSVVDPKNADFSIYHGATVLTPNRKEAEVAIGRPLPDADSLADATAQLRKDCQLDSLLVTLGADGMFLCQDEGGFHLPTAAQQVFDVTGAGDTVAAMLAVALAEKVDWKMAVRLANIAAGLAVARVGTVAVGRKEILHHLCASSPAQKIILANDVPALEAALESFRREGARLVFTNGCFDILHAGHVRYLGQSRRFGDALVVGLNADTSVRRLKGASRPIQLEVDRAEILAALECVDLVILFEEDTPKELIERVCPDVLVKGADWKEKGVVGADFVQAQGGEVRLVDILPGRSTTSVVNQMQKD
jgi:D-beta-D-heptose 7-phosphate kinase/D-beta-D-heptose 1-phosphate adenosyltransferase